MNKKYDFLLAADSGGSKTDWICLTQDGTIVKKFTTPGMASLHVNMLPIKEYMQLCCKELQDFPVKAVYLSLGGPNTDEICNNLKQTFPDAVVLVEREASGDLVAACMDFLQCSAVVMAGTGITAVGFNADGSRNFAEGWGPVYGDCGSGYWIGLQAIKTFLQSVDNIGYAGKIPELFERELKNFDVTQFAGRMELKKRINALTRREVAALTPQLMQLAVSGDRIVEKIIMQSAEYIAQIAAAVTPANGTVLMLGGLFKMGSDYRQLCKQYLQKLRPDCSWMWYENCNIGKMAAAKVLMLDNQKISLNIWEKIIYE